METPWRKLHVFILTTLYKYSLHGHIEKKRIHRIASTYAPYPTLSDLSMFLSSFLTVPPDILLEDHAC